MAYLALTLLIEIPVLFLVVRGWFRLSEPETASRFLLIGGFSASALTYPYLWFLLPILVNDYTHRHVIGELLIIVTETLVLYGTLRLPLSRAFWASFICNGASIGVGVVLNHLIRTFHWFS